MAEAKPFTGRDLIAAGYEPGPWFGKTLSDISKAGLTGNEALALAAQRMAEFEASRPPRLDLQDPIEFQINITAENEFEKANMDAVLSGFQELVRTPTVIAGAIMPDACPAGPHGTIPVGGVIAAKNAIHPGMHSSDVCCSMFLTTLDNVDPKDALDAAQDIAHFGPGGRPDPFPLNEDLRSRMIENPFLNDDRILRAAWSHLGTSGDGNHHVNLNIDHAGQTTLITHHGSRGLGALLYKKGLQVAEKHRLEVAPDVLKQNAWIPFDSKDGQDYWAALQIVRDWTKENHRVLHDAVAERFGAKINRRIWNEHNFVFAEDDVIWHAKGATPIHTPFLPDSDGIQILPLNMSEPILLIQGERNSQNLGFAPHGAGRNMSRSAHKKLLEDLSDEEIFERETRNIDARFHCGNIDISELPSAYKNAASVQRDMERFNLARVVERIEPFGSIMAGDWELDAPWKKKTDDRDAQRDRPEEDDGPGF